MSYHFNKTVDLTFDDAVARATEELKKEGFGVLTQIDVRKTMKEKKDVDFRPYLILGACNQDYALQALTSEERIGSHAPMQRPRPGTARRGN